MRRCLAACGEMGVKRDERADPPVAHPTSAPPFSMSFITGPHRPCRRCTSRLISSPPPRSLRNVLTNALVQGRAQGGGFSQSCPSGWDGRGWRSPHWTSLSLCCHPHSLTFQFLAPRGTPHHAAAPHTLSFHSHHGVRRRHVRPSGRQARARPESPAQAARQSAVRRLRHAGAKQGAREGVGGLGSARPRQVEGG